MASPAILTKPALMGIAVTLRAFSTVQLIPGRKMALGAFYGPMLSFQREPGRRMIKNDLRPLNGRVAGLASPAKLIMVRIRMAQPAGT